MRACSLDYLLVVGLLACLLRAATATVDAGVVSPGPFNGFPPACVTFPGMSQAQCRALNAKWVNTAECLPIPFITTEAKAAVAPFAWWVGTACPTPCAVEAKKRRKNPRVGSTRRRRRRQRRHHERVRVD